MLDKQIILGLGLLNDKTSYLKYSKCNKPSQSSGVSCCEYGPFPTAGFLLDCCESFGVFSLSFAPSGQGGLWVSLEQGNLDQNVKWEPAMQRLTVRRYLSLSAESLSVPESERPELLIWPETAMPFDYQTAPELSAAIRAFARDRRVALLFGAPGFRNRGDGVARMTALASRSS